LCQKFKHCLKKLAIVDVTLERLGTTLNYQQLYTKTVWLTLGWFAIVILINCVHVLFLQYQSNYDIATIICISIIINYCSHVNLINDLIIARTLGLVSYIYIYIYICTHTHTHTYTHTHHAHTRRKYTLLIYVYTQEVRVFWNFLWISLTIYLFALYIYIY